MEDRLSWRHIWTQRCFLVNPSTHLIIFYLLICFFRVKIFSAAGVATQRVLQEEGLIENAVVRGKQLKTALKELQSRYPVIAEVRGPGLMIGMEFHDRKTPGI